MNQAQAFETYVRHLWPLQRHWAKRRIAHRCRRCIISERHSALDASGLCAACAAPQAAAPRNPPDPSVSGDMHRLLHGAQGAGRGRHDALVLFSGGKDSTYIIHRLQTEFPHLRLLAYTVDNTFMSPTARQNVEALLPRLGVDHVFYRPRQDFMRRLFRHTLTHLNAQGCYGTVDFSDGEHLLDAARIHAATHGIPLVLCGYSRYQVEDGLQCHGCEYPMERQCADRVEVAGIPLADIFSGDDLDAWWQGSRWPREKIPRLLFPLYAWDLSEETIRGHVVRHGLLRPGTDSPVLTNHELIPLCGVVDIHRFGYASFEPEFSRMIREGRADARVWRPIFEFLEYTSRTGLFVKPLVDAGLARLGLTYADVGIRFGSTR